MSYTGGAVAAIIIRTERQLIGALRDQAAYGAETAVPLDIERAFAQRVLGSLLARRVIRQTDGGLYYVDDDAYEGFRARRRKRLIAVTVVALLAAVAAVLWIIRS